MSVPALAVAGPLLLMVRLADVVTVDVAVAALFKVFGSAFSPLIVAVLFSVPANVGLMFAISVNCADATFGSAANVQFTVPGLPTPGSLQTAVGPLFWMSELKVVPAGRLSMRTPFVSASGPLFMTVIVQAIV